jgi:hypothetical protein
VQASAPLRCDQRLEAGDHVEHLLVGATVAQTPECPVEVLANVRAPAVEMLVEAKCRSLA